MLVFSPHAYWLQAHEFQPFVYAQQTSLGASLDAGQRVSQSMRWLADMLLNRALPAWLQLAAVMFMVRKQRTSFNTTEPSALRQPAARSFLLIWGFVPLAFTVIVGLATGAELQLQWGTAFLLLAVPAVMELIPVAWKNVNATRVLCVFVGIQALLLVASHLSSYKGPASMRDKHWRSIDSAKLAQRIAPAAMAQLGGEVKVVMGSANLATAIALQLPGQPTVLIDGRYDISPWVQQDLVKRCGAVEIVKKSGAAFPIDTTSLEEVLPGWGWRIVKPEIGQPPCQSGKP
jgi:hypothetical protein